MHTLRPYALCAVVVASHLAAMAQASHAQAVAEAPAAAASAPVAELTTEAIQKQIAQVNAAADLDAMVKATALESYQKALAELDRAAAQAKQAAAFKKAAEQAPADLETVRRALDAPAEAPRAEIDPDASLAELETALAQAQNELNQAQDDLTRLEAEPTRRADRRLKIPAQIDEAGNKLEDAKKQLAAAPAADEPKAAAAARQIFLRARQQALTQEIASCTSELESYNAEDVLLPKQRDLALRQVTQKKRLVEAWQKIIHRRRQHEAEIKLNEAKQEKQHTWPELRDLASENEELAKRAAKVGDEIGAVSKRAVDFTNTLAELGREFKGVTDKVETLGLAPQLGPYLLQFRVDLARRRQKLEAERPSPETIDDARMALMSLTDQRRKLSDVDAQAEEVMRSLDSSASGARRSTLAKKVRELLQNRRDLLDSLTTAYERYIRELATLLAADKQLFDEISRQTEYIDENILWVRSTSRLGRADLVLAGDALRWYAQPDRWLTVGRRLTAGLWANPLATAAALLFLLGLLVGQRRMRTQIKRLGDQAARGTADDISLTLRALCLTLLMAAPWPVLLGFLGWTLDGAAGRSELAKALAHGLGFTAVLLASLEFLRHVCRSRGLGTAHFGWPEQSMRLVRKHLRWFMPLALPLALAAATTHALENDRWHGLERLLFMAAMALLSIFLHRVLRPVGGVLHEFLAYRRGGWLDRLNYLVFPLTVCSPLALACLAGWGYYYTARQLAGRLQATAWLMVAFMITGALILRWLLILRRRLAMRQARLRRAAAAAESRSPEGGELPAVSQTGEGELDLTTINRQTRRFVQTALVAGFVMGLWLTWADVLPALSFLNKPLWQTTIDVVEKAPGTDGTTQWVTTPRITSINVSHVLLALLFVALTVVATRNIPGLLEIVLLQRLPLEPATRYAVTTLSRYVLAVAGMVCACLMLGITWSKVHWLVAAVSVGLGFGLQEIFANFVSGLIILFERPVRVGDIVTVDDVSGVVSRIRIRATMITDFDRKELIVPNKEFITGRVLNWTLSDQMNRVVVNVGVAYGSDIERVRELLLQMAHENSYILKDPAPMATFEGFGDSTLSFVLRCYLPNLENRMSVVHDLHSKIHDRFREENIDIAFPQLDLHIRSTPMALYQRQAG
ncbi:MAG TPA: mechanosensitive ion channel domain-containing protein [Pirellulales bacterium]